MGGVAVSPEGFSRIAHTDLRDYDSPSKFKDVFSLIMVLRVLIRLR